MPELKTKAERVKETVRLVKELQRVGFKPADPGYKELYAVLTKWVEDGESAFAEIPFMRHGRDAEVNLPKWADKAATIRLKAWASPKEEDETEV
jgi:hypothetical protein